MLAIGFRAEKDAFFWAVVEPLDATTLKLVAHDEVNAAETETVPESLKNFREQVRLLVDQYAPDSAIVRAPETYGRRSRNMTSVDSRLRVEGVIMEALASKGVTTRSAALKSMSALMHSSAAKEYLDGEQLRGIKWPNKNKNCREAILAAVAGLGTT